MGCIYANNNPEKLEDELSQEVDVQKGEKSDDSTRDFDVQEHEKSHSFTGIGISLII